MRAGYYIVRISAALTLLPLYALADDTTASPGNGACSPPSASALTVPLRAQHGKNWCWAASGQMIMEYLGKSVPQCSQANTRFNRTDCCNDPIPDGCDQGGWPEFEKYGFTSKHTTNAALDLQLLRAQLAPRNQSGLCGSTPIAFTWYWVNGGGSGHMKVATGYYNVDGVTYIRVNDPLDVDVGTTEVITYTEYVSGPDHYHWNDYYEIKQ